MLRGDSFPQLFKDQRKAREEQIITFKSFVEELNKELLGAKNDRDEKATKDKFDAYLRKAKLKGFITVKLDSETSNHSLRSLLFMYGNRYTSTHLGTEAAMKNLSAKAGGVKSTKK